MNPKMNEKYKFKPLFNVPVPGAKPCPFCGETDIRRFQLKFKDSTQKNMFHKDGTGRWTYLQCSRCNILTEAYQYEHQALKQWNRRASDDKK